jgi:hypothetical protein
MNDLSLLQTFSSADADDIGHRFRGDFIDKCGLVERWLAAILALPGMMKKGCSEKTPIGTRLKTVRAIAENDGPSRKVLKRPEKVIRLLDRFQPYAELRTVLAHATQAACIAEDGSLVFLYRPVGDTAPWSQIAITEASQSRILGELRALAKEFNDQQPASAASPS